MSYIIGLAGVKTSGKSTVTEMIKRVIAERNPNISVEEAALANKLKEVSAEVFNIPRENFDRQDLKEVNFESGPKILTMGKINDVLHSFNVDVTQDLLNSYLDITGMELESPRKVAQIVGTQVLRATGNEDIHCENVNLNLTGVTIISDIRFPNEFEYFNSHKEWKSGFLPIYIKRDEAEALVTEDSHESETSVFKFSDKCVELPNNGSLEDLETMVFNVLKINSNLI